MARLHHQRLCLQALVHLHHCADLAAATAACGCAAAGLHQHEQCRQQLPQV